MNVGRIVPKTDIMFYRQTYTQIIGGESENLSENLEKKKKNCLPYNFDDRFIGLKCGPAATADL